MPRKEKATDYSPLALARRLVHLRAEISRMGGDGRLSKRASSRAARAVDNALEEVFVSWLKARAEKEERPHPRENWDRNKWEKKLVVGYNKEPYKGRYLERAELHEGGIWDKPNYGE